MSTMEELMAQVRGEGQSITKQASQTSDDDYAVELLGSLKNRVEEDATTSRIVKHASVAASVFTKEAAENFKKAIDTDEFRTKLAYDVASIIMNKLALDTQVGVIPDAVANENPVAPQTNPMDQQTAHADPARPAVVAAAGNATSKLLAQKVLVSDQTEGGTISNDEVAKQAAAQGVDESVLEMLADRYMDVV